MYSTAVILRNSTCRAAGNSQFAQVIHRMFINYQNLETWTPYVLDIDSLPQTAEVDLCSTCRTE